MGKKKVKCHQCRKKLKILTFACKCGHTFCSKCRYPSDHQCTFDYVAENKKKLEKDNPKIEFNKLEVI